MNVSKIVYSKRWLREFGQLLKVDVRAFQEDQIYGEAT